MDREKVAEIHNGTSSHDDKASLDVGYHMDDDDPKRTCLSS